MTRAAVAVLLLACGLWLLYGLGTVGYDTTFALAWGEDLAALDVPDLEGSSFPTPHPLATAVGVVLATLGDTAALTATRVLAVGSLAGDCAAWPGFAQRCGCAASSTRAGAIGAAREPAATA